MLFLKSWTRLTASSNISSDILFLGMRRKLALKGFLNMSLRRNYQIMEILYAYDHSSLSSTNFQRFRAKCWMKCWILTSLDTGGKINRSNMALEVNKGNSVIQKTNQIKTLLR